MRKFPKIKYPNHEKTDGILEDDVVVTEKLDGANTRFQVNPENQEIILGTRNTVQAKKDNNGEYVPLPKEETNRSFRHILDYLYETMELSDYRLKGLTVFGESLHLHSLEYDGIEYEVPPYGGSPIPANVENFYLFDIFNENSGKWLNWDEVVKLSEEFGLSVVPVIERGNPEDLELEVPDESVFGGSPEGIVVRRIDGTIRAKKVTDDFKEENAVAFDDPSKAQSDAAEFVAAFITKPRIEKVAHKLVDEGDYDSLEMPMMEELPRKVIEDAITENAWDLMTSGGFEAEWTDDFKGDVRSRTSKKCVRLLKQMINEF